MTEKIPRRKSGHCNRLQNCSLHYKTQFCANWKIPRKVEFLDYPAASGNMFKKEKIITNTVCCKCFRNMAENISIGGTMGI